VRLRKFKIELSMPAIESLTTRVPVELRSAGSGSRTIGGYAAVFGHRSEPLDGFIEQVDRRFFNKSRGDNWPGVVARFNHENGFVLGTTQAGTLRLSVDNTGLDYAVDLPESRADVLELVARGDIAHSSFAFQTYEDDWGFADGKPRRTLISGRLIDVAPVTTPAYRDTSAGLRSLARYADAPIEDVVKRAQAEELRSFFIRTDIDGGASKLPKPLFGPVAKMRILEKQWAVSEQPPLSGRQAWLEITGKRWGPGDQ
jgi:uncharacterized protein